MQNHMRCSRCWLIFQKQLEGILNDVKEVLTVANEALWLTEKFNDGVYVDVAGLCKIAIRYEIAEKNYSLTPGAYVGVADVQEEDENFEERMKEIHAELNILQNESNSLMEQINANLKELGLGEWFMATKNSIKLFQDKIVRSIWDDEKEEWFFSVNDVVQILTDSTNVTDYIKKMRKRDEELSEGWGQIVTPLYIQTAGGKQKTNFANA